MRQILQSALKPVNLVLIVVFSIHLLWVLNHARLHAEGVINPWKGGGYAMYTNLSPQPRLTLHTSNSAYVEKTPQTEVPLTQMQTLRLLDVSDIINRNRFFKCQMIDKEMLITYVKNNRSKLKKFTLLTITERELQLETRRSIRRGKIALRFTVHKGNLVYEGIRCGKKISGRWPLS